MARIKTSGLITDITGSINGSTFQNSIGGLTMKSKSVKRKSFSVQSNDQSNILQVVSSSWRSMSQTDRDTWQAFSSFAPIVQNNGSSRLLNGQQIYFKYACWYYSQFTALPGVPTFATEMINNPALLVRYDAPDLVIDSDTAIDEGVTFVVFKISASMQPSRIRPQGGVKQIILTFANTNQTTITIPYTSLFGRVPLNGEFVFIEYWNVSATNPFWANPVRLKREVDI